MPLPLFFFTRTRSSINFPEKIEEKNKRSKHRKYKKKNALKCMFQN